MCLWLERYKNASFSGGVKGSNEVVLVYPGSTEYHTQVRYKDIKLLIPQEAWSPSSARWPWLMRTALCFTGGVTKHVLMPGKQKGQRDKLSLKHLL